MSDEIKLKNDYQDTFNEVHAPAALSRKVMNMSKTENKRTAASYVKKVGAAAAVALAVLVGGNGIVYAATGNSLLKTVKVYFNGSGYEVDLEEKVDDDGVVYYEGTFETDDAAGSMMITDVTEAADKPYEVSQYGVLEYTPDVVEKDGKYYLVDGSVEIDITEDLEDGKASGSYEKDGLVYEYEVSGEEGSWSIGISNEE